MEKVIEKIVHVEVPVEIEKVATGDLNEAARLLSFSELNKEDLTEQEILALLQKTSEDDVKRRAGFWAMPMPREDTDVATLDIKYTAKKK